MGKMYSGGGVPHPRWLPAPHELGNDELRSREGHALSYKRSPPAMASQAISVQDTNADDHHQLGQAEKAVELLKTLARAWLHDLTLDESLAAHAMLHAAQVLNRIPDLPQFGRITQLR